ncbi:MAG TPA: transcriptional regulator [Planctomycetota bacterium]|nr:transcriptional regulator [Planctomycetota bacterium]
MNPSFDSILLSQARLGIVTVLVTRPEATFSDLKEILGLTQGNLGIHLNKLEEAGYVAVRKEFVERKPRTTARITEAGRRAFLAHVDHLASVARQVNG